jgi:large conductance mechanosensitive channel
MVGEFRAFLLKQNIIALAIAVVVGTALNAVVQSVVDQIIMPFVGAATPGGAWREYKLHLGPVALGIGALASALLNFAIVGFVAWRISKLLIKAEAPAATPPPTQTCGFCYTTIDARATRCPSCTSQLAVRAEGSPVGMGDMTRART